MKQSKHHSAIQTRADQSCEHYQSLMNATTLCKSTPYYRPVPNLQLSLLQILVILSFFQSVLSQSTQSCLKVPQHAKLSYLHSIFSRGGNIKLCPGFIIDSEDCDTNGRPFTVSSLDLTVACDNFFGYGGQCTISCSGSHFEVQSGRTLILEGITLTGASYGSVTVQTGGNLIAFDSTWEGNKNENGEGAAVYGHIASSVSLTDDHFVGNDSEGDGGALFSKGSVKISSCELKNNSALNGRGGALFAGNEAVVTIRQNTFEGNSASIQGPTIYSEAGAVYHAAGNDGCDNVNAVERSHRNMC